MATRRPLVIVEGLVREIPIGDVFASDLGGEGSSTAGPAGPVGPIRPEVVEFAVPYGKNFYRTAVPLSTLTAADTVISCSLLSMGDSDESDSEDLVYISVQARAVAGGVELVMSSPGPFGGSFALGLCVA